MEGKVLFTFHHFQWFIHTLGKLPFTAGNEARNPVLFSVSVCIDSHLMKYLEHLMYQLLHEEDIVSDTHVASAVINQTAFVAEFEIMLKWQ